MMTSQHSTEARVIPFPRRHTYGIPRLNSLRELCGCAFDVRQEYVRRTYSHPITTQEADRNHMDMMDMIRFVNTAILERFYRRYGKDSIPQRAFTRESVDRVITDQFKLNMADPNASRPYYGPTLRSNLVFDIASALKDPSTQVWLKNYTNRLLRNNRDNAYGADDLYQDVCVRALQGASFRQESKLTTWLASIARNHLRDKRIKETTIKRALEFRGRRVDIEDFDSLLHPSSQEHNGDPVFATVYASELKDRNDRECPRGKRHERRRELEVWDYARYMSARNNHEPPLEIMYLKGQKGRRGRPKTRHTPPHQSGTSLV